MSPDSLTTTQLAGCACEVIVAVILHYNLPTAAKVVQLGWEFS
jgi:hypothetical protein